jgi:hypothetical protein
LTPDPDQPPLSGVIDVPASPTTSGSLADHGPAAPPGDPRDPNHRPRRWFIVFAIFSTAVLCCVIVALLYVQWFRSEDRSVLVIVWGPPEWDGATAVVSGPGLSGELRHRLTKENDVLARFHVPPGLYVVSVVKDGQVLARKDRDPRRPLRSGGVWWPFRLPPAATQAGMQ